ncbi:MAG: NusG domain II-containing protein [Magnetococcales bacterium]|nr:NusG domain II-containing protein [Magnetococcales bacterium]
MRGVLFSLWQRATTPMDRWLVLGSVLGIIAWISAMLQAQPGSRVGIFQENRLVATLPLDQERTLSLAGRLGEVRVQVEKGRVRLQEYQSPRLIGTRTGWIQRRGEMTACVPCGVFLRIEGVPQAGEVAPFDAISR